MDWRWNVPRSSWLYGCVIQLQCYQALTKQPSIPHGVPPVWTGRGTCHLLDGYMAISLLLNPAATLPTIDQATLMSLHIAPPARTGDGACNLLYGHMAAWSKFNHSQQMPKQPGVPHSVWHTVPLARTGVEICHWLGLLGPSTTLPMINWAA
eukprot:scaffold36022_cov21-Tisochrysis_lutea.AAC.1